MPLNAQQWGLVHIFPLCIWYRKVSVNMFNLNSGGWLWENFPFSCLKFGMSCHSVFADFSGLKLIIFFLSIWWIFHLLCRFIGLKKEAKKWRERRWKICSQDAESWCCSCKVAPTESAEALKNVKSRIIFLVWLYNAGSPHLRIWYSERL